ncbi:hypothetical protein DFH28DRAFT_956576 [Melampsora americana]|nr:hypothetical protein DFH28DRAFT_956576 [Melampsora americana]
MKLISSTLTSSQIEPEPHPNSNTRLLWRGSILTHTGSRLHGLAIVAHSIDLNQHSNFKLDPFNPNQPSRGLSARALELEMLRGRDLQAQGLGKLIPDDLYREQLRSEQALKKGGRKARLASLLKGKAPANDHHFVQDIPFSDIECDSDLKVYIDPRCGQTRDWIMSHLCKRDLMEVGWTRDALIITLDHSSDDKQPSQLLIFGQATSDPSPSQATNDSIPLQLVIGQRVITPTPQIPRPDDPMPRLTTSFIEKLKPSAPLSVSSKDPISACSLSKFKSRPQELSGPNSESKTSRNLFKSTALVVDPKSSVKRGVKLVKRPSNTPGRRLDSNLKSGLPFTGSCLPEESMMLTLRNENLREKRGLEESDSLSVKRIKSRSISQSEQQYTLPDLLPPSHQEEEVQDENEFSMDRSPSPSPASFKITRQFPPIKQYVTSPSETSQSKKNRAPTRPPLVSKSETSTDSTRSITKSNSSLRLDLLPTVQEVEMVPVKKSTGHLTTNKALIRKLALASLSSRGIEKGHVDFKDLFAAICRGVQFAMRKELEVQEIDKTIAQGFVEGHLAMYKIMTPVESVMLAMKLGTTTTTT